MTKVSVIICNVEKYLKECLDSVLQQTLKDIEVICVDDGSTDQSSQILREYQQKDSRLKIVYQDNKGAGAARNLGMKEANGQYLFFMDSDHYCTLDFLEKATKCADEKKSDILVFDFCRFDEQTGEKEYCDGLVRERVPKGKEVFSYIDNPEQICKIVHPTSWNKLYSHEFVKENKLQWLEVSTESDITFATLSVLAAKRITYLNATFIYYRVGFENSIANRKKYCQDNVIKTVLSIDHQAQKLSYYDEIKNSVREFIAVSLLEALKNYTPDSDSIYHVEFEKKISSIFFSYPLFLNYETYKFDDTEVYKKIGMYRLKAMERQDYSFAPRIIVSMTSFPQRIHKVYIAISSIFQQTKKPDMVMLWLAEEQFPNKEKDLPEELLEYQKFGLQIRWCKEDIRPHKKYYYVMKEYPEDIVITVDDDLTYEEHMIEKLFVSYLHYPYAVSTVRTHLIKGESDSKIASYNAWIKEFSGLVGYPSMQLFSTSGAGTLFPPHCMDEEVFNMDMIKSLCLNADDLWLKVMQVRKGTPVVLVDYNRLLCYIPDTQEVALRTNNVYRSENDKQLEKVLSVYDKNGDCEKSMLCENIDETKQTKVFDLVSHNKYGMFKSDATAVEAQRNLAELQKELSTIKDCKSFKIGLAVTYIPRKIRLVLNYLKEEGCKSTFKRIVTGVYMRIKKVYGKISRK